MKCVILAAGEGVRMRPLTLKRPKPLLLVNQKPILEHIVDSLSDEVSELILVVGYLGDQIESFCGPHFKGRKVSYVWQKEKQGTARALKLAQPFLGKERFLLLYADDLHSKDGIAACLKYDYSILVADHSEPQKFGVVSINSDGSIKSVIEKPRNPESKTVSTGVMVLDQNIFSYEPDLHSNGENYLTSMFDKMLRDFRVMAVKTDFWFPIATPDDLSQAEKIFVSSS